MCNSALIAVALVSVTGCDGQLPRIQVGRLGDPAPPSHFLGLIVGDEPNAVQAGQKMLMSHGNAADAAVAVGLALAITLPSRAGLGGGGACVIHDAHSGVTEVLDFMPEAGASPVARPALVRGLFAMHARYGVRPWAEVVMPAETMARFGTHVSRAFARDLADAGSDLLADSAAFSTFLTPSRQLMTAGDVLRQEDLAAFLTQVRAHGGAFGAIVSSHGTHEDGANDFTPRWLPAQHFGLGNNDVFTLPSSLSSGGLDVEIDGKVLIPEDATRALPSGSGFTVADGAGNVVSCALTMGRPFGLGRLAHGLGFLLAPGDAVQPLAPVVVINRLNGEPRFAAAAAGVGAIERVAAMLRSVGNNEPLNGSFADSRRQVSESDRPRATEVNAWFCPSGLLSDGQVCMVLADPRGDGYALVVVPDAKM